jgi:hypothetical protein
MSLVSENFLDFLFVNVFTFQLRKKNRFSGEQLGLPEDFCVPLSAAVVELVKIKFFKY